MTIETRSDAARARETAGAAAEASGALRDAAREYVLAHLEHNPNLSAYASLRRVLEQLGDPRAAQMTWAFAGLAPEILESYARDAEWRCLEWALSDELPLRLSFTDGEVARYTAPAGEPPFHYCIEERLESPAEPPPVTGYAIPDGEFLYREGAMHVIRDGRVQRPLATGSLCVSAREQFPLRRIRGTCAIVADYFATGNYAHWLLDWIPRVQALRRLSPTPIDYYFVDDTEPPYRLSHLVQLGIAPEQIISAKSSPRIVADQLVFSMGSIAGCHPAHMASAWAVDFIVDNLREPAPPPANPRLFVSRQDAPARHLEQEDRVFALLEQRFGFERIVLSRLSAGEQASRFQQAEAVVGVHGAGLANIVFCRPGTRILEMFSPVYGTPAFFQIAHRRELKYWCLNGEDALDVPKESLLNFSSPHGGRDIRIDPNRIANAVEKMLA